MAELADLSQAELDHPLTVRVRAELGPVAFLLRLRQDRATIEQALQTTFANKNIALHDRLLQVQWLQTRIAARRAG